MRTAATELVYTVPDLIRWYQRRGGANGALLRDLVGTWATALCPMLPHVAEEMYARAGGEGLCSSQPFPEPTGQPALLVIHQEDYLKAFMEDAKTIIKLAGIDQPEQLTVFTSPSWKQALLELAVEMDAAHANGKFPMGEFMGKVMADPDMRRLGKAVQKFAGKLPGQVKQLAPWQQTVVADADEAEILRAAAPFLKQELGVPAIQVFSADQDDAPDDPKKAVADPLKPGIALK